MWKSRSKAFADQLGFEEVAQELEGLGPEDLSEFSADAVFNAQQTVLGNIMVVSALMLGFIVTGTLLSVGLTGRDNFGIDELMDFFRWSAVATMFAFISLTASFLTSVAGSHRMSTRGVDEAAKFLTGGSVLRRILAEGSLYMSMLFFLISLDHYIWMVYSGPDICPTYRGAASFCARQGQDFYFASEPACRPRCQSLNESGRLPDGCQAEDGMMDCLCMEVCGREHHWKTVHNFTTSQPKAGVFLYNYHYFPYRLADAGTKPAREKVMTAAASLMCNHGVLEAQKEDCFQDPTRDCDLHFLSWQKSEECMESAIQDALSCAKVCAWTAGYPPRTALKRTTDFAFWPLGVSLILLTIGRVIAITIRALAVFHNTHQVCQGACQCLCADGDEDSQSDSAPL